ncbi:MAG: GNAT family N-acetyltransferase [Treponema sp.]|jgi:Leu/Phe-tRNA-protein transferase|nr:GNAT family N-acetyltransferase [Treponema sp.]
MRLTYTKSGHLFISPKDDCHKIVNAMLQTGYNEEFCVAWDFNPDFIARLMEAGFLVMSANIAAEQQEPDYILLPKLHLVRSALFFENLHIKKSIRRYLPLYELRPDSDFELIVDRCVEKHGNAWLTPPLVEGIKKIREMAISNYNIHFETTPEFSFNPGRSTYPLSFALYNKDKLAAGEFGVICGGVYTSYSGFYDEKNAGTVQMILTAQFLKKQNFTFFDLGMPLEYKNDLGAVDISPGEFVAIFHASQF